MSFELWKIIVFILLLSLIIGEVFLIFNSLSIINLRGEYLSKPCNLHDKTELSVLAVLDETNIASQ